ncbi:MAG TPA: DUF2147 domain-containing protein [Bacteroidales bacterium]|nr:DUF2147 domain-containing protein [Bacteroidales bacterium]
MKKSFMLLAFAMFFGIKAFAQADQIIGLWLTEEGNSQIEISKAPNGQYIGRIVWMEEPLDEHGKPKVDEDNPNTALRNRPLQNLMILQGFTYNANRREWSGGTIYDPKEGKTYDAVMRLDGNNTMVLRGFVMGMRMLGRNSTWTRERARR